MPHLLRVLALILLVSKLCEGTLLKEKKQFKIELEENIKVEHPHHLPVWRLKEGRHPVKVDDLEYIQHDNNLLQTSFLEDDGGDQDQEDYNELRQSIADSVVKDSNDDEENAEDNVFYPEEGAQSTQTGSLDSNQIDLEKSNSIQQMKVKLVNYRDAEYIGDIYLGAPISQRATVVLDTGSSWLNVKSCFNNGQCHRHDYESKPENQWPKFLPHYREKILHDTKNKHGIVYYMNKSQSGHFTDLKKNFDLAYGSANLNGGRNQDYVCLRALPDQVKELGDITSDIMRKNFCVKDIRFMTITESKGMDTCDGIMGISPKSYAKHSFLQELKTAGIIDQAIISFSNNFHKDHYLRNITGFKEKNYAIFGGINASQIIGGEDAIVTLDMPPEKLNPRFFWGVHGNGFAYKDTAIMDPEEQGPILAVIDSGTTLIVLPFVIYENFITNLAEQFRDDEEIDFVCERVNETNTIDHCYFNNTKCTTLYQNQSHKFGNLQFQLGKYVFQQNLTTTLRESNNTVAATKKTVPACSVGIRGHLDEYKKPKKTRFLIGNIFLKNFYSIYNYDRQQISFGVNIHSKGLASIIPFKKKDWANYKKIPEHLQQSRKNYQEDWQKQAGHAWEIEVKIGETNGDLPQEQVNFNPKKKEDSMLYDLQWRSQPEIEQSSQIKKKNVAKKKKNRKDEQK